MSSGPGDHDKVRDRVLNALQESLNEGEFGEAGENGMVLSFVTIVETIRSDGDSGLSIVFSDARQTVILGLLNWAHMWAGRNFGTGFAED